MRHSLFRILSITAAASFITACSGRGVLVELPPSHASDPQATESTYHSPPNPFEGRLTGFQTEEHEGSGTHAPPARPGETERSHDDHGDHLQDKDEKKENSHQHSPGHQHMEHGE
jgi:hypothetical protein